MVSSFVAPADDNRLRSKRQMALDRHRQDVWWIRIGQHFRVLPCFVLSPTPPILIYIYSFTTTLYIVCIYTRAGALCAQARGRILLKQNRLKSILNFSDLQILLKQKWFLRILLKQKLKQSVNQCLIVLLKQNLRAWNILLKQNKNIKALILFVFQIFA